MKLTELLPNQRYLFYYKSAKDASETTFRANFIKLFTNGNISSLLVTSYYSKKRPNENIKAIWSIDADMISDVESLSNIIDGKCVLPDDVLLEIDNYY
jgi:hypothetical protein